MNYNNISGLRVTVMGLGLNGGGLPTARFFLNRGADVTVTDLQSEEHLQASLKELETYSNLRLVLGRHEMKDFVNADLVIKNPAVRKNSPYLQAAQCVETDISVFLQLNKNPVWAITGSKGKSTTVSALYHGTKIHFPAAQLGGNITVSPLSFVDKLDGLSPVILELSSWQLADLENIGFQPDVAAVTNLLHDHQNYYTSMDDYAKDKAQICLHQNKQQIFLYNYDDAYADFFCKHTEAELFYFSKNKHNAKGFYFDKDFYGCYFDGKQEERILPSELSILGEHNRYNLLLAAAFLRLAGIQGDALLNSFHDFKGIEHRMEIVANKNGVQYINDSAATIPEATAASLKSMPGPCILLCGGTDKNLDFTYHIQDFSKAKDIVLLTGTATDKLLPLLKTENLPYHGPYDALKPALEKAANLASAGDYVLLSPGCASFGMFKNEFDRGSQFRELVKLL